MEINNLIRRVERLKKRISHRAFSFDVYRDDPLGYIRDILRLTLTTKQEEIVRCLMAPPRRVLVASGHSVGKTILAACLVNWWFDTRKPAICLTTAPTDRQVKDLLWKEVRVLRQRAGLPNQFTGPKIPRLETSPDHFAHGFTAGESTRFQGHHSRGGVFIVFDEAEGVDPLFWQAAKTMLDDNSYWLCCYNPTTPGSAAHLAEQEAETYSTFTRVNMSCLEHPNILASLAGEAPPFPGAITLAQAETMLMEDSQILDERDPSLLGDVELNGKRYRPGPVAEARVLGRRPLASATGIWSEQLWSKLETTRLDIVPEWPVAIGCDVARYGDDQSVIFVRKGKVLLHAELHVKQNTSFVAQRLRELCEEYKDSANAPKLIPCLIDEGGIGGGVVDQNGGYLFVPVNAACSPRRGDRFKNVRAELWFGPRDFLKGDVLDIHRIPKTYLIRLKQELLVATYKVLPENGKIAIQSKDDMKAILGRSPDLADAFNLCLYPPTGIRI